ncbi:MAG: zinc ABC transporter substrate-binding protein [Candidatus Puniceispirillales bacterium]
MSHLKSIIGQTRLIASFIVMVLSASVSVADTPRVAVDIAPVHSLVARVMDGVDTPALIIAAGASPHEYSLRPSEAAALQKADVIFWIGPELTPWLDKALSTLAQDAVQVSFINAEGTILLPYRESALFERHDHDDDHADHDDHDDHANHDQHPMDPHLWLSPENGIVWMNMIAEVLVEADPTNAATYRANSVAGQKELINLQTKINTILAPHRGKNFITFHDGFQYFEDHFNFPAMGAIALSDASQPGPARLAAIRERIANESISCVLSEPQYQSGIITAVTGEIEVNIGVVDAVGYSLELGRDLYPQLLRDLAEALAECLA